MRTVVIKSSNTGITLSLNADSCVSKRERDNGNEDIRKAMFIITNCGV